MSLYLRSIFFAVALLYIGNHCVVAQQHELHDNNIHSLSVVSNNDWQSPPVIELRGRGFVDFDFDDLSHVYRRLAYKVEHCEADWSVSQQLFESDYVEGFYSGNVIEDVTESLNTNTLYTHYHFRIPNSNMRLKLSGNYRVTVYDDNDEERPVATAYFMVVDPRMGVTLDVTGNTDIGIHSAYQQVSMDLNYGSLRVTYPETQLHTYLVQNQKWYDVRANAPWQYMNNDGCRWEHCRQYIFHGGNEYRKFEILDVQAAALHVDNTRWDGHDFIAMLDADVARRNYVYDEDANGAFYIRNRDNIENDRTCEYLLINFTLPSADPLDGEVYVNGQWAVGGLIPRYKMEYDAEKQVYHTTLRLKQGYYSYQYVLKKADGSIVPVPSEGSYYQTENAYQAFVYYREQGGRTDELVGYAQIKN